MPYPLVYQCSYVDNHHYQQNMYLQKSFNIVTKVHIALFLRYVFILNDILYCKWRRECFWVFVYYVSIGQFLKELPINVITEQTNVLFLTMATKHSKTIYNISTFTSVWYSNKNKKMWKVKSQNYWTQKKIQNGKSIIK